MYTRRQEDMYARRQGDIGDMDKKETRRNESIGEKDKGGRKKRDKDIKTKEIGECWALR